MSKHKENKPKSQPNASLSDICVISSTSLFARLPFYYALRLSEKALLGLASIPRVRWRLFELHIEFSSYHAKQASLFLQKQFC